MIYHFSNIATIRYGALKLYTFILYQIWMRNIKPVSLIIIKILLGLSS